MFVELIEVLALLLELDLELLLHEGVSISAFLWMMEEG